MRRILTYLIFSLFLTLGTGEIYADRHNDRGHDRDRKEQRYQGHKHDKGHNKPGKGKKGHKGDKHSKPMPPGRPGNPGYGVPPKPHGASFGHRPGQHMPPPPPPRLGNMVRHATRGCHDVAVWQINPDTYIVKYRKGNRLYTQYLYPYSNRYGECNLISVNWRPLSPWNLIPAIQLNINL